MEEKMMDLLVQLAEGQKQLFTGQKQLESQVAQLAEGQKQLESRMAQLAEGQKRLETRVEQLTEEQKRTNVRLDALEQRATKTEVILENRVMPQLQLLAEGHTALAERLDRMDETYARKEDVEVLKLAVRHHTEEIREIKTAM